MIYIMAGHQMAEEEHKMEQMLIGLSNAINSTGISGGVLKESFGA